MPIAFHEARQQILDTVPTLAIENIPLLDAAGRAVARDIIATQTLPGFDNSAMDGYAVRIADCTPGTVLPVADYSPAGESSSIAVDPGTVVKVLTGAQIPAGADTVIPFEDCQEEETQITILQPPKQGAHIRWRGEDIAPNDLVIKAGTLLRPAEISLLASLRTTTVPVHRRARVALLATGDELQEAGELPFSGGVVNSNSIALAAAVEEIGSKPLLLGIARDNRHHLREKIEQGLQADLLITSAGVSAGDRDLVREVLEDLGVKELFWKVLIKPGYPIAFGLYNNTPVFSLPGNPVSALLTFEAFVRPALLQMMGHRSIHKPLYQATLTEPIRKKPGRLQLLRVAVSLNQAGELEVKSAGDQNTGMLRTLIAAQGVVLLAAERDFFAAGEKIEVQLLGASTALGY